MVARKLAEELNKKILILKKRKYIAGNMYDYQDDNGIMVHLEKIRLNEGCG